MSSLNVRIYNKFDTYEKWMSSSLVLGAGEIAVASIPSGDATGLTPPAIGIKVGDGSKTFAQLSWIQATAGDVYGWAKAATKPDYKASEIKELKEFVEGISDIDTNTEYSFSIADNYKIKVQKKDIGGEYADYQELDLTAAFAAKADKVAGAVAGNFAGLDANGNLTDSGKKATDFAEAGHNHDDKYAAKAATEEHIADTEVHVQAGERTKWNGAATQAEANKAAIELLNKTDGTAGSVKKTVDDAISALDLENTYAAKGHNHDDEYDALGAAGEVQDALDEYIEANDQAVADAAGAAADALAEAQAKVASVTAGDASVTIGGTATAPTVAAKLSQDADNALELAADGLKVVIPAAPEYSIQKAADSGEYAAVYNLTKDGAIVGASINIPKDLVVKSGSVVGDEIVLVLNDEANTEIKIAVGSLIEYVTSGSQTGDMVVVNVSDDHKVTATITDGAITLAKLSTEIQTAIGKAHSHENEAVLAGITSEKVANWEAALPAAEAAQADADALEGRMDTAEADIDELQQTVNGIVSVGGEANVLEDIDGVEGAIAEGTKTFTVTGVSTDLLKQGSETLIFNCGSSAE